MENENAVLPISLFPYKDYTPHFLDLSGTHLFPFHLDIKRFNPPDTDPRDLNLLINDSVFDIPYAFHNGLLELIDEETGTVVLSPPSGKLCRIEKGERGGRRGNS